MMSDVLEKLDKKINELESGYEEISDKWKYIEELHGELFSGSVLDIVDIDETKFFVAYIGINNNKIDFEFLKKVAADNREFFEVADENLLKAVKQALKEVSSSSIEIDNDEIEDTRKVFKCDFGQLLNLVKNQEESEVFDALESISKFKKIKEDAAEIIKEIDEYLKDQLSVDVVAEDASKQGVQLDAEDIEKEIEFRKFFHRRYKLGEGGKGRKKLIEEEIKKHIRSEKLPQFGSQIIYAKEAEEKRIRNKNRNIRKEVPKYKEVRRYLSIFKDNEQIPNISYIVENIEDEELLKYILDKIYKKNIDVQLKKEKEYKEISVDRTNKLKVIFDKYNIDCSIDSITRPIEEDELEYDLKTLTRIGFDDSDLMICIVNNTEKYIVENVANIIKNNYVTKEFVRKNVNIFDKKMSNESTFAIVMNNIKTMNDKSLNPRILRDYCDVFLMNNEKFERNFTILYDYDLLKYFRKADSYDFIANDDLAQRIDIILELGLEKFLKENLAILDYSVNDFKKVFIMKEINEEPKNLEDLLYILTNDYIKDEKVGEYIFNYVTAINEDETEIDISDLAKFDKASRVFDIDGILISKNKVYAKVKDKKVRLCDIVNNSILSSEEYETIEKEVLGRTI